MKNRIVFGLVSLLIAVSLTGCGASGGEESDDSSTAPTPITPPIAPVDISGENNFKYSQTAKTASGWSLTYDSADSNEHVVLPSGWVVEVKYE